MADFTKESLEGLAAKASENSFAKLVLAALILDEAGKIRCKLSDEAKALLNQRHTANTTVTSTQALGLARTLNIQEAISKLMTPAAQPTNADVISDEIAYTQLGHKNRVVSVPCSVAKTGNSATASIKEASILKVYGGLEVSEQKGGREMIVSIKEARNQDIFSRPTVEPTTDCVVKRAQAGDVRLSATVFPEDIRLGDALKEVAVATEIVKQHLMADTYDTLKDSSREAKLTIYKNANRSLMEEIFEGEFVQKYGQVTSDDADKIHLYTALRNDFLQAMSARLGSSVGDITVDLGLRVRRQSIQPNAVWSSINKVGHVHQFSNGSYYVSTQVDMGIGRVPATMNILTKYADKVDDVVEASLRVIEAEARAELGLPYDELKFTAASLGLAPLDDPELLFRTHLGISREDEIEFEKTLRQTAHEVAANRIAASREDSRAAQIQAIDKMLKGEG